MATNGLTGPPPDPETLPPKKRNSKENPSEASAEHIFKTPSPFWNRNGFKRPRRTRDPVSLYDLYSSTAYHTSWSDVGSVPNPAFTPAVVDNGSFPTWGHHYASVDHLMGLPPTSNGNDPMRVHSLYGAPSYWNYFSSEPKESFVKSYRRPLNPYRAPIIKPIPQSLTSPYSRGVLNKDGTIGEDLTGERMRMAYWNDRIQNHRALQDWKMKRGEYTRDVVNLDHGSSTELTGPKYYSEFKDLSQAKDTKPEEGEVRHQPLTVSHPSCASTEHFKWRGRAHTSVELPLLGRNESAEEASRREEPAYPSSWLLSRFVEGSLIELVGGRLKKVEDLRMEDFEYCTETCPELSLRRFSVLKVTPSHTAGLTCLEVELQDELHSKLSLEVCDGYPFFVCQRGWSSCSPEQTGKLCSLRCRQLQLGDVCLALAPGPSVPAVTTQPGGGGGEGEGGSGHREEVNCQEKPTEATRMGKPRRRHCSAPELRNTLQ